MAEIKIGDVWAALDRAALKASGAALGFAYFQSPGLFRLPNRGFYDHGVASQALLQQLAGWDVHLSASGGFETPELTHASVTAALTMADWSDPGTTVITGVQAIGFYIGGWTPHVWTTTQIKAQTVALMLPIWVYDPNKPGSAQGTTDGQAAVAALKAFGVPGGVRCVLDMEGSVDAAYCSTFRGAVAAAGYWTTIYGSSSSVFGNWSIASGPGGGWWPADWTGSPHLYNHAGVWATQWTNPTGSIPWDQSVVAVLDHLWPHIPASFSLSAIATATTGTATKSSTFTVAA